MTKTPEEYVLQQVEDYKISDIVIKKGFKVIMTSSDLLTGTDRVAEASKNLNYEIFINVQGDEPFANPIDIESIAKQMIVKFTLHLWDLVIFGIQDIFIKILNFL